MPLKLWKALLCSKACYFGIPFTRKDRIFTICFFFFAIQRSNWCSSLNLKVCGLGFAEFAFYSTLFTIICSYIVCWKGCGYTGCFCNVETGEIRTTNEIFSLKFSKRTACGDSQADRKLKKIKARTESCAILFWCSVLGFLDIFSSLILQLIYSLQFLRLRITTLGCVLLCGIACPSRDK